MSLRDAFAALLIAIVWGAGFVAMKIGVREVPPIMFSALRFTLAAFPAVFFIAAPKTKPWIVIAYGFAIGVMQFSLVFTAIKLGMPAGLSSLVIQSQVFFTILFAWAAMGEKPGGARIAGGLVAMAGVIVIASERAGGAELFPFLLVIGAAISWSAGNMIGKLAGRVDMVGFTVWSSLAAIVPLFALSMLVEGPASAGAFIRPGWPSFASAVFLAWVATLFGYSMWANLLSRYPAAMVAPFSLLVPVFGFLSAQIFFDEPTTAREFWGALLVLAGLTWVVLGAKALARLRLSF